MASMVMRVLCAIVIVACMVVAAPYSDAITCGQVTSSFVACFGYLKQGGAVPPACCHGVVGLSNTAKTTLDR
ncbi:hypothetical protein OSB04_009781 [Centaurea solstitialis]|uniref:Non-specific lipid-transfer protein n=1 Tax=Centaurea solstitialis TaxID=347529 RepID=A0AA38WC81_9ASTR|nr:hypothetical protein OSB04_009781 [Centaurea solstitialis]